MATGGMNMLTFNSPLAAKIQQFIALRQLSGTNYYGQALLLSYFDRFLVQQSWCGPHITCQIIDEYWCSLSSLAPRGRGNRFCVVKQLCEYIAASDPQSYVPEPIRNPSSASTYKPYIYTLSEIRSLMNATSRLTPINSLKPHTCRALIGLLYSTGIRIGEAMALNIQDFYPAQSRLFIADGKFHKARWVPLAPSACTAISSYIERRCKYFDSNTFSPLFINLRDRRLRHSTVSHDFHCLQQYIGMIRTPEVSPRIHDLRHTLSVHRLLDWYKQGLDVNALLPALATYMGHVEIVSTQVYLQPTQALLAQVNQRFHQHYLEQVKPAGEVS